MDEYLYRNYGMQYDEGNVLEIQGRDHCHLEERGRTLAHLLMMHLPSGYPDALCGFSSKSHLTDHLENARFEMVRDKFRDICSSGENITWNEVGPSSSNSKTRWMQGPVIYFAMIKAMEEYNSGIPSQSMHADGRLLHFLVKECHVDLNALYSFEILTEDAQPSLSSSMTQRMKTQCNALSHVIQQKMRPSIPLLNLLLGLDASPNVHFHYQNITENVEEEVNNMNHHSLLYASFWANDLRIGQLLFENGGHFNLALDPSPMATAMQFNPRGDVILMFKGFKNLLSPEDIATNGGKLGTPLHCLVHDPMDSKHECEELVKILIQDLNVLPSMVDSQGRTATDLANEVLAMYIKEPGIYSGHIQRARQNVELMQFYLDRERAGLASHFTRNG